MVGSSLSETRELSTIIGRRRKRPSFNNCTKSPRESQVVYLLTYWAVDEGLLHAWAVPEDVAFDAFGRLPAITRGDAKRVEVSPEDHQLQNAPFAPSFAPYYVRAELTVAERAKLLEAIKTDDNIKQERSGAAKEADADEKTEKSASN